MGEFESVASLVHVVGTLGVQREGWVHARCGQPRGQWESPFVQVFGARRRVHLDIYSTQAEWMRGCNKFIATLCSAWQLSQRAQATSPSETASSRPPWLGPPREQCDVDHPLPLPSHPLEAVWGRVTMLWVQVAYKILVGALAGC